MRFTCTLCGKVHEGVPGLSATAPLYYYGVPDPEKESRCRLTPDTCVVDEEHFFVRGCLEVPILGEPEPFVWGLWTSLSQRHFETFLRVQDADHRSHVGPFFGWLSAHVRGYPDAENLKTMVHLRDHGVRPYIELEPTEHPLAIDQRQGISRDRAAEILSAHLHG